MFISDRTIAEARSVRLSGQAERLKSDVRNDRQALMAALRDLSSSELEDEYLAPVDLLLAYLDDRDIYDAFHMAEARS